VAVCILISYYWGKEESGGGERVRKEAQHVARGKVDGEALRRLSSPVQERLRVEGEGPARV
jgi:hypothetical protein